MILDLPSNIKALCNRAIGPLAMISGHRAGRTGYLWGTWRQPCDFEWVKMRGERSRVAEYYVCFMGRAFVFIKGLTNIRD